MGNTYLQLGLHKKQRLANNISACTQLAKRTGSMIGTQIERFTDRNTDRTTYIWTTNGENGKKSNVSRVLWCMSSFGVCRRLFLFTLKRIGVLDKSK